MDIRLDYGRAGLPIRLADTLRVSLVEPSKGAPIADPTAAVEEALRQSDRCAAARRSWHAAGATRWW